MLVNKKIKETLDEISSKAIEYTNLPDKERKYLKRLLNIFYKNLTEDDQLFILKLLLEQIYYKNIITDPDNIIQIHNIKLKTITYIFFLVVALMIIGALTFRVNEGLNSILDIFENVIKILTL